MSMQLYTDNKQCMKLEKQIPLHLNKTPNPGTLTIKGNKFFINYK